MAQLTIPKQAFQARSFKGRDGKDVPITVFAFTKDDIFYQAEAVGDHKALLTRHMDSGQPLDVPDADMTFDAKYGWKVKLPREGGGGGNWKGGGGGGYSKPKYSGKQFTVAEWASITGDVFTRMWGVLPANLPPEHCIDAARSFVNQFWICVENNIVIPDGGTAAPAQPAQPTQPPPGQQPLQTGQPVNAPPTQEGDKNALDYYLHRLSICASQVDVQNLQTEVNGLQSVSEGQKIAIRQLCFAKQKELAARGA